MVDKKHTEEVASNPSRRNFLKMGGAAAATATVGAAAGAGFVLGRDPDANVGWGRTEAGKDMFFNREPFRVDIAPSLKTVGKIERPEWGDFLFNRVMSMGHAIHEDGWVPTADWGEIPDPRVREYYARHPERWKEMLQSFSEKIKHDENYEEHRDRFALGYAYSKAFFTGMVANFPPLPTTHPDEDDFKSGGYASRVAPIFLDNFHFKPQIVSIIKETIINSVGELK